MMRPEAQCDREMGIFRILILSGTSTPSPKFLGYLGRYMPDCYYPKNLWNGALGAHDPGGGE
jgi:hypothetical protein